MTDYQTTILNRLPEYEIAARRSLAAGGIDSRRKFNTHENVYEDLIAKATKLLDAGKPLPDDFAKPYHEAKAADEMAQTRHNILAVLERRSANTMHAFKMNQGDVILDELRTELAEVVDSVRDLATSLVDISTADEAIDRGAEAIEAWTMLRTETQRYRDIRTFQFQIYDMHDGNAYPGNPGMQVRESLDVDPYFVDRRNFYANQSASNTDANSAYQSWMRQAADGWTTDVSDGVIPTRFAEAHLLRLVTTYTLWLPSLSDRRDWMGAAHTASARVMSNDAVEQINARFRAYSIAGIHNEYTEAGPVQVKRLTVTHG
jgi:hypothetical protein